MSGLFLILFIGFVCFICVFLFNKDNAICNYCNNCSILFTCSNLFLIPFLAFYLKEQYCLKFKILFIMGVFNLLFFLILLFTPLIRKSKKKTLNSILNFYLDYTLVFEFSLFLL